jgi:hypothetical protein
LRTELGGRRFEDRQEVLDREKDHEQPAERDGEIDMAARHPRHRREFLRHLTQRQPPSADDEDDDREEDNHDLHQRAEDLAGVRVQFVHEIVDAQMRLLAEGQRGSDHGDPNEQHARQLVGVLRLMAEDETGEDAPQHGQRQHGDHDHQEHLKRAEEPAAHVLPRGHHFTS